VVIVGPKGLGPLRRALGGPCARLLGWFDGVVARGDKSSDELHKFKDRAELGCADAASWWSRAASSLNSEVAALTARLSEDDRSEPRLEREVEGAQATYAASRAHEDENRLRRLERDLAHLRQERGHLTERLRRVEAEREAAYQRARSSANEFIQYYESLMRSYAAANKKAPALETVPQICLPDELQERHYNGFSSAEPRPPIAQQET
jgi:chromosome segregation ATPase